MSTAAPPKKRLYTIAEAAEYLGRSAWSIRRLIWGAVLPSVRVQGRVHLDVADMDELIQRSKCVEDAGVGYRKLGKVTYGAVSAKK
jgi:excisionase family DNA binding protein